MEVLGQIKGQNLSDAWNLARSISFNSEVKSTSAPRRLERWYRYASNLQSIKAKRDKIWFTEEPHERLRVLGDRLLPGWDSLLACKGEQPQSSTTITPHRDHGHFEGCSVMLNLGEALYRQQPDPRFDIWEELVLTDGIIVRIDTKITHEARQLSRIRYNFTFRVIKPQFLPCQGLAKQLTLLGS
jgi:hypothetical protein